MKITQDAPGHTTEHAAFKNGRHENAKGFAGTDSAVYVTKRMRVGETTLTVPESGCVSVKPDQLRQVFQRHGYRGALARRRRAGGNGFSPGAATTPNLSLIHPVDPKQLPKELAGVEWPPKS